MIYGVFGAMLAVIVFLIGLIIMLNARHNQLIEQMGIRSFEREQSWAAERQQLLNRIQATSYAEYKTQEIRTIKAQNGDKEPLKLEPV